MFDIIWLCFVGHAVLGLQALAGLLSIPLHSGISTSTIIEEQSTNRRITTFTCGIPVPTVTTEAVF